MFCQAGLVGDCTGDQTLLTSRLVPGISGVFCQAGLVGGCTGDQTLLNTSGLVPGISGVFCQAGLVGDCTGDQISLTSGSVPGISGVFCQAGLVGVCTGDQTLLTSGSVPGISGVFCQAGLVGGCTGDQTLLTSGSVPGISGVFCQAGLVGGCSGDQTFFTCTFCNVTEHTHYHNSTHVIWSGRLNRIKWISSYHQIMQNAKYFFLGGGGGGLSRYFTHFEQSILTWVENGRSPRKSTRPPGRGTWLVSHDPSWAQTHSGEMTSNLECLRLASLTTRPRGATEMLCQVWALKRVHSGDVIQFSKPSYPNMNCIDLFLCNFVETMWTFARFYIS